MGLTSPFVRPTLSWTTQLLLVVSGSNGVATSSSGVASLPELGDGSPWRRCSPAPRLQYCWITVCLFGMQYAIKSIYVSTNRYYCNLLYFLFLNYLCCQTQKDLLNDRKIEIHINESRVMWLDVRWSVVTRHRILATENDTTPRLAWKSHRFLESPPHCAPFADLSIYFRFPYNEIPSPTSSSPFIWLYLSFPRQLWSQHGPVSDA